MTVFAGQYIIYNSGTAEAKSALAVFTQADSRLIWVVKTVHGAVCFLFQILRENIIVCLELPKMLLQNFGSKRLN